MLRQGSAIVDKVSFCLLADIKFVLLKQAFLTSHFLELEYKCFAEIMLFHSLNKYGTSDSEIRGLEFSTGWLNHSLLSTHRHSFRVYFPVYNTVLYFTT